MMIKIHDCARMTYLGHRGIGAFLAKGPAESSAEVWMHAWDGFTAQSRAALPFAR